MDPVVIIAGLILLGITIYLVASPLLKTAAEADERGSSERRITQGETKEAIFTTLAEIEFDYQMGKLTEEDYLKLKGQYQPKAVRFLESQENTKKIGQGTSKSKLAIEAELEQELEQELAQMRKSIKKKTGR